MQAMIPANAATEFVSTAIVNALPDCAREQLVETLEKSEITFVLDNDPREIQPLIETLREQVDCFVICDDRWWFSVQSALHEALTNALFHGNLEVSSDLRSSDDTAYYELADQRRIKSPYRDRRIHLTTMTSRHEAIFTIADEGPGFDCNSIPNPCDPDNLTKPCGRGLWLIRHCMDRVVFNDTGNRLTMTKRLA